MEVQIDSDIDTNYGKISFMGNPSDYVTRVDWDAALRKVFWIGFTNELEDLIKKGLEEGVQVTDQQDG